MLPEIKDELTGICASCKERWNWVAFYKDGGSLRECDGSGTHRVYADIDQSRVTIIEWQPIDGMLTTPSLRVSRFPQRSATLVLFRRHLIEMQMGGGPSIAHPTIHGLGREWVAANGEPKGEYWFIMDDGSVVMSEDKNAV